MLVVFCNSPKPYGCRCTKELSSCPLRFRTNPALSSVNHAIWRLAGEPANPNPKIFHRHSFSWYKLINALTRSLSAQNISSEHLSNANAIFMMNDFLMMSFLSIDLSIHIYFIAIYRYFHAHFLLVDRSLERAVKTGDRCALPVKRAAQSKKLCRKCFFSTGRQDGPSSRVTGAHYPLKRVD